MKKVISFVLVLALVLGSFSMAFAAPAPALTDVDGDANEQAITVVNGLGIVTGYTDGSFQADKAVTRAEFAAMITRALAIPESALAGYTTTTFNDTTGYGWAVKYLAFCADKGIMLGDGAGNVMPGRTINVNEAMTMVLRAVGYTNSSAVLVGSWPSNYVTLAQNLDLYDDVEATATVDRGSAAQIIYNALTVGLVQVNSDGETNAVRDINGVQMTLLTTGLNCDAEDVILVDEDTDDIALIDVSQYLGASVIPYTNDKDEIVAVEEQSTFLEGTFNADGDFVVGDVTYTITGTTSTTPAYVSFENGVTTTAAFTTADGVDCKLAVDVTGKKIEAVYSQQIWTVEEYVQFVADDTLDEEIASNGNYYFDTYLIPTYNNDDNEYVLDSFILNGVASLEDIAEDDIVTVYIGDGKITRLDVTSETVTGKITKINSDGEYVINGKAYATATGTGVDLGSIDAGQEGTATLNYAGEIVIWDATIDTTGNYAVVLAYSDATDDGFDAENAKVKLFTKEGEEKVYFAEDDYTELTDLVSDGSITIGAVVTYSLNKAGELNAIDTTTTTSDSAATFSKSKVINGTRRVADNAVVFVETATGYELGTIANISTDENDLNAVWDNDANNSKAEFIVVQKASMGTDDSVYAVISTIETALDADDEKVYEIAGLSEGKAYTALTDDYTFDAAVATASALVKLTVEADGTVTAATDAAVLTYSGIIDDFDGTLVHLTGGAWYQLADNVIVYQYDTEDEAWVVSSIKAAKKAGQTVYFYNVAESDDYYADVAVYVD